ncbi:MAG: alkaline phosphatase [Phycisphaerae bacterium]|nr:alkaline phosphatase [Phycisphaerae bacterium]
MKLARYFRSSVFLCILVGFLVLSGCTTTGTTASATSSLQDSIKYVFYFIGDGMGSAQIHLTEAYLASVKEGYNDNKPESEKTEDLIFTQFPAMGMITTYCANRFITDSAAAGTALACGEKTMTEVVSLKQDKQTRLNTIAERAKAKGMKVGIVTSVGIDHATPAVFYAHEPDRDNYYNIGVQLANSDFDYFAGGSLHQPTPPRARMRRRGEISDANAVEPKSSYEVAADNGFKIVTSREELSTCKPGERVIAYNKSEEGMNQLTPEIDRPDNCMSLAEFTEKGINLLDNNQGFFMMVEGGQVDYACHDKDTVTAINEILAFDEAIDKAMDFYKEHPDETLIVVTADHETGGLTMGNGLSEYSTSFEILKNQNMSYAAFKDNVWSKYTSGQWGGVEDNIPDALKTDIENAFGLVYDKLNDYEKDLLEDAYDKGMSSAKRVRVNIHEYSQEDKLLYSDNDPLSITLVGILAEKAGIGWTTFAHTGIPVEVHAIGSGSEIFNGFYDNTDVPKKMAKLIGIELGN